MSLSKLSTGCKPGARCAYVYPRGTGLTPGAQLPQKTTWIMSAGGNDEIRDSMENHYLYCSKRRAIDLRNRRNKKPRPLPDVVFEFR